MVQSLALLFTALVLEALPFLVLGALLSGFIEVFLPQGLLTRRLPKNPWASGACGLVMGLVIPTCECGSVPVVRRLLAKGAPAPMAFAYLLAATVVNPMVLFSTWMAFPHKPWMVLLRAGLSLGVAAITTTFIVRRVAPMALLPLRLPGAVKILGCGCGCVTAHTVHTEDAVKYKVIHALDHARLEFSTLFAYLSLGAALAALAKTFLPDRAWFLLADYPMLAVPGLMAFSFALSLCSEADAFVAASLSGVSSAAQLAFLALGPVLDVKLLLMYRKAFAPKVVRLLVVVPVLTIFVATLLLARVLP